MLAIFLGGAMVLVGVPAWAAQKPAVPAPVQAGFIGNKASKVYHVPGCKLVAKIKPENQVSFESKAEAEKAGYQPCRICLP